MADFGFAGVVNLHARGEAELDGLAGERISARNHRLAGNNGGQRGQHNQRNQRPFGHAQKKRIFNRFGRAQQKRALADIVQSQSGQHQREPGRLNRPAAEMPHIGIQSLGTRYRQHHRAQAHKAGPAVMGGEIKAVIRIDGAQHRWVLHNLINAGRGQRGKPKQHHRPEKSADALSAFALDNKQHQQHRQCNRQHPMLECRVDHCQALGCREHRNGRRDHGIAEKHRRAGEAHHQHHPSGLALKILQGQLHQHHHAAFAFIVGMQDKHHIFERHHQNQRPNNQRHKTQYAGFADLHMRSQKGFFQRVERARADVAIHNAQGGQNHGRGRAVVILHEFAIDKK